jgi:DNA-binding NarL/FixJ family response regulator
MVDHGNGNGTISVCPDFLSGSRWYTCRLFDLEWPVNGHKGSSLALLLERRPKPPLAVHRICRQYKLTARECQAVEYLLEGLANKEIAMRMRISPNTVKVFLRLAMAKMGVTSRAVMMSKFIHGSVHSE